MTCSETILCQVSRTNPEIIFMSNYLLQFLSDMVSQVCLSMPTQLPLSETLGYVCVEIR